MSEDKEEINVVINVNKVTKVVGYLMKNWHFVALLGGGLWAIIVFLMETHDIHKTYPLFVRKVVKDSTEIFWLEDRLVDLEHRIEQDSIKWKEMYDSN